MTSHTKIRHTPISIQNASGWPAKGRATFMPYALTTSVGTIIQIVMTFNFLISKFKLLLTIDARAPSSWAKMLE